LNKRHEVESFPNQTLPNANWERQITTVQHFIIAFKLAA